MFNKRPYQDRGFAGKSGGNRFGGGGGGGRDWDRGSRGGQAGGFKEMHRATCGQCGESCEVPFRPNGSRPVLCSNCFKRDGQSAGPKRFERRESSHNSFESRPSFAPPRSDAALEAINAKLDAILKILNAQD